jgi:response regulator RpfG family c-di-GMP phosphodiesterase
MDGAELLRAARLRWPDVTRILLTGNADLPAAARAVNEGQLSHLATKPWQPEEFRHVVSRAIEQRRVLAENRRLRLLADQQARRLEEWNQHLEETVAARTSELEVANASLNRALLDAVRLLTTFMEQRLPDHAARSRETARLAGRLAERAAFSPDEVRRIQVAALVHDIGLLLLPPSLVNGSPTSLPLAGRMQYQQHAELGQQLIANVERLREMGRWIRHHHERWDGKGYPDGLVRIEIPMPSRIIALASAYFQELMGPTGITNWLHQQQTEGRFDPDLVQLLEDELRGQPE